MAWRSGRLTVDFDWPLIFASLALTGLGLLLIYSLTGLQEKLFFKQLAALGLGLAAVFFVQLLDRHFWRNASAVLYILLLSILAGLLLFGADTRGTQGWIYLGGAAVQPAEFAKVAVIIFLATVLEKIDFDIANWRHLALVVGAVGLPAGLIALEPDFGSAFIIITASAVMVLYAGLPRRYFLALLIGAALLAALSWGALLRDYQKSRVLSFLNPQADPLGAGYNVRQSIVAIGSGGLSGRGLGLGTQSQLNFLPEQETDFIFASLAEELGFIGAGAVLVLYLVLLRRIYLVMKSSRDLFTNFMILGLFAMFLSQAFINIGMNMGLMPVTGITLPFLSYGGSSLLVSFFSLGLIENARRG